jgi:hypothetical protein
MAAFGAGGLMGREIVTKKDIAKIQRIGKSKFYVVCEQVISGRWAAYRPRSDAGESTYPFRGTYWDRLEVGVDAGCRFLTPPATPTHLLGAGAIIAGLLERQIVLF